MIQEPQIIQLPKILDDRGNLSFLENQAQIPFDVKRVHWIYDVPGGEERGAHAHKELYQLIIAASGSFAVTLDDGSEKKTFNQMSLSWGVHPVLAIPQENEEKLFLHFSLIHVIEEQIKIICND